MCQACEKLGLRINADKNEIYPNIFGVVSKYHIFLKSVKWFVSWNILTDTQRGITPKL